MVGVFLVGGCAGAAPSASPPGQTTHARAPGSPGASSKTAAAASAAAVASPTASPQASQSAPTAGPRATLDTTPVACADMQPESTRVVTRDGTTYDLVVDEGGSGTCSILATNVHGVAAAHRRIRLDAAMSAALLRTVRGDADTLFVFLDGGGLATDAPSWYRLLVIGPEGIRADIATAWELEKSPAGTWYLRSQVLESDGSVRTTSLAALGQDGRPSKGWPYTVKGDLGWPIFAGDGTAYLAQSTADGHALVALSPAGALLRGWPAAIPGEVPRSWTGLRAPRIADDGSLYDAFATGVYWFGRDGKPKPGWPYVMPGGMSTSSWPFGIGGEPFGPLRTSDETTYLPVTVANVARQKILCLRADASACPGWPARLPDGWFPSWWPGQVALDAQGSLQLRLWSYPEGDLRRDVTIRRDGTQSARVIAGDTISGLAEAYGVSQAALLAANPHVTDPSLIHPGDMLVIPPFTCPALPVSLATLLDMTGSERLGCFGNTALTFRAYGRGVGFADGPCFGEPAWLNNVHSLRFIGERSGPMLRVVFAPGTRDPGPADDGVAYEITGRFDDPAAGSCTMHCDLGDGNAWDEPVAQEVLGCREQFVITDIVRLAGR